MTYTQAIADSIKLVMDKYSDRVNIPFMEAALEGAKAIFEEYGQAQQRQPATQPTSNDASASTSVVSSSSSALPQQTQQKTPTQNTNAPPQSSCISNTTSAKSLGCNHDYRNPGFIEKGIEWGARHVPMKKVEERNACTPEEQRELYHIDIRHGWVDNVRDYFKDKEKPQDYDQLITLARKWDTEGSTLSNTLNTQILYNDEATVKKLRETISINSPSRYMKSSSTTPGK